MTITRLETLIIPNTLKGRQFADQHESWLKANRCFIRREEGTVSIAIYAKYPIEIKDVGEEQDT